MLQAVAEKMKAEAAEGTDAHADGASVAAKMEDLGAVAVEDAAGVSKAAELPNGVHAEQVSLEGPPSAHPIHDEENLASSCTCTCWQLLPADTCCHVAWCSTLCSCFVP